MSNYRRVFIPGGCYFFTVNLIDRHSSLLTEHIDALLDAVFSTQRNYPFEIDALVILPDHLHAVWTLPEGDADYPARWRSIKTRFSRAIPRDGSHIPVSATRAERGIWQRRYWEHTILDDRDLNNHIDYCWFNPVKHGYVEKVEDWPFSSFHRDHRDAPKPTDFETALAEHNQGTKKLQFGERD
jgi:putative transposase